MNGLYIHIPFCLKKCAYCDFVSYENRLAEGENYVNALLLEMKAYKGTAVDTVYIGGGTPTVLPPHLLIRILLGVKENFIILPDAEITVEANPGTCDGAYFEKLRQIGVNRVSLGVQSFVDEELKALGRIHSAKEAKMAVQSAKDAGILNVSLDLMFSIPLQTKESFLYSINEAIGLQPTHISSYSLIVCENTPIEQAVSQGKLLLPDEDEDRDFYALLVETLEEAGYERYEISNFSKPGKEARHNTKYWTREPYIGLGAAAHSFWEGRRFENPSSFSGYYAVCRKEKERVGEAITEKDAMAEFMFLGLRMTKEGISKQEFLRVFGVLIDEIYGKQLEKLCRLGLLEEENDRIRLTERGIDVSNGVFCEFV
ncbi:MAG: radical SAM family heme chaperone HemW [Ruminococcaceae bacterium]|nr:radical SAM family heme chaperone HemW [Oscillospiraceae bacterium]